MKKTAWDALTRDQKKELDVTLRRELISSGHITPAIPEPGQSAPKQQNENIIQSR